MNSVVILFLAAALCVMAEPVPGVERAWKLIADGQRDQAMSVLRDTIKATPGNAEARLLLGSLLMESGDRDGSVAQLKEAVRLLPRSADAHNALGEAYNTFGDPASARPEFERAVALNPKFAQAHANLGAVLLQQGESAKAEHSLDRAIQLLGRTPDASHPHYLRAKIYSDRRDPEAATRELQQAVELSPDFAEAWSDLGEARRSVADDTGALAAFRRAVELKPDDAVAQVRLGSKLLDTGNAHDAAAHLKEAVRLDPTNQSALYALQTALRRDGRAAEAAAVKQQLTEIILQRDRADQAQVQAFELNNRGIQLEKTGDLKGAVKQYRAALELQPEHVGFRTNLAVALLKLGQWSEGIAELSEALKRDPDNKELKKALADAVSQARAHGAHR